MGFIFLEMIVIAAVLLVSLKLLLNEQTEETYKVGSFCPVNRSSLKGQRVSWF